MLIAYCGGRGYYRRKYYKRIFYVKDKRYFLISHKGWNLEKDPKIWIGNPPFGWTNIDYCKTCLYGLKMSIGMCNGRAKYNRYIYDKNRDL